MSKNEIIVLLITIFVSVFVLALLLNGLSKEKVEKPKKDVKKEPQNLSEEAKKGEIKEETTVSLDVKNEDILDKENEKIEEEKKAPQNLEVSQGLQDELNEFRAYLKERITPESVPVKNAMKHPYRPPKFNPFDDDELDDFDDDFSFSRSRFNKKSKADVHDEINDLSIEMKMLLLSSFFDHKF